MPCFLTKYLRTEEFTCNICQVSSEQVSIPWSWLCAWLFSCCHIWGGEAADYTSSWLSRGVFGLRGVQWHCGVAGMLGRRPIGGLNLPELDGKRNKNDQKKDSKKKRKKEKQKRERIQQDGQNELKKSRPKTANVQEKKELQAFRPQKMNKSTSTGVSTRTRNAKSHACWLPLWTLCCCLLPAVSAASHFDASFTTTWTSPTPFGIGPLAWAPGRADGLNNSHVPVARCATCLSHCDAADSHVWAATGARDALALGIGCFLWCCVLVVFLFFLSNHRTFGKRQTKRKFTPHRPVLFRSVFCTEARKAGKRRISGPRLRYRKRYRMKVLRLKAILWRYPRNPVVKKLVRNFSWAKSGQTTHHVLPNFDLFAGGAAGSARSKRKRNEQQETPLATSQFFGRMESTERLQKGAD